MKVWIIQKAGEDIAAVCGTKEIADKELYRLRALTDYPHHYEYDEYEVIEEKEDKS